MSRDRARCTAPAFDEDETVVDLEASDRARVERDSFYEATTVTRPKMPVANAAARRERDSFDDVTTVARRALDSFDDVTTVARRALDSFDDVKTTVRPAPFDDLPTRVWTPPPRPTSSAPGVEAPAGPPSSATPVSQVSGRRIRGAVDTGPNVRVEPSHTAWPEDEVTRIEAPPPVVVRPAEEITAPGNTLRRKGMGRLSPVGLACAALVALIGVASAALWRRSHHDLRAVLAAHAPPPVAHPVATSPLSSARAPVVAPTPIPPVTSAPTLAAVVPPRATAATPAPSPASLPSADEAAAVDAVESGDVRRAARLYATLALSHPTNDAFREAARILSEAAKESHP